MQWNKEYNICLQNLEFLECEMKMYKKQKTFEYSTSHHIQSLMTQGGILNVIKNWLMKK